MKVTDKNKSGTSTHLKGWGTRAMRKLTIFLIFVLIILMQVSCFTKLRTRQFVVEDKSLQSSSILGWKIIAPELIAFYKQAGVNHIPNLDTNLFQPLIKIEKPTQHQINQNAQIDSINITILDSNKKYVLYPSSEEPVYTGNWNKERYQYIYFNKHNSIQIPTDVEYVFIEFEIKIVDDKDDILESKLLKFKMKREESSRIGLTYGD